MKKILIIALFIIVGSVSGQIKILDSQQFSLVGKTGNFGITKKQETYQISYQDINTANLNTYRLIKFENKNNDFSNLKEIILRGLEAIPEQDIVLEFPNDIVYLHFEMNYRKPMVQFIQLINKNKKYIGKSNFLTRDDILKVFGTKK